MIMSICSNPDVLKVLLIVKVFIRIIKIAVPIALILFASINYLKKIMEGKDDDLKSANKRLVNMVIAAVFIFLVPTLISTIINLTTSNGDSILSCIKDSSYEGIDQAYVIYIESSITNLEESLTDASYMKVQKYINKLNDDDLKYHYNTLLNTYSYAVKVNNKISNLTSTNLSKNISSIKEMISSIEDEEIAETLTSRLEDKVKSLYTSNYTEYVIAPASEYEKYQNLKQLKGKSLENLLKENGYTIDDLNEKIKSNVEISGVGTREASVSAVVTLIGFLADLGYKLPYYWGGKWTQIGVNKEWGLYNPNNSSCSMELYPDVFKTKSSEDNCKNNLSYYSFDCSGLVTWAVIQGNQKIYSQDDVVLKGTKVTLGSSTSESPVCGLGDILRTDGHYVIIIGIDYENKRYIVAESNNGVEMASVNFNGERSGNPKYWCVKKENFYTN